MVAEDDPRSLTIEPSWLDRLSAWVIGLPVPDLVVYGAAGLGIYVVEIVLQWIEGAPVGLLSAPLAMAVLIPGVPFLVGRFNGTARQTIEHLPPEILDPGEVAMLEGRLTALPARWALIAAAVTVGVIAVRITIGAFAFSRGIEGLLATVGLSTTPVAATVVVTTLLVLGVMTVTFVLKVAYTAYWIDRIGRSYVSVDLYDLAPLYGFSRLSAAMALSAIAPVVVIGIAVPETLRDPLGVTIVVALLMVAALVFVLPLTGLHGRLVAEKGRLQGATTERILATRSALHRAVDANDLPSMDPLQKAITALEIDQRMVNAIPTWPWEPATLRWVVGALMFPVVLFTVQLVLSRTLS